MVRELLVLVDLHHLRASGQLRRRQMVDAYTKNLHLSRPYESRRVSPPLYAGGLPEIAQIRTTVDKASCIHCSVKSRSHRAAFWQASYVTLAAGQLTFMGARNRPIAAGRDCYLSDRSAAGAGTCECPVSGCTDRIVTISRSIGHPRDQTQPPSKMSSLQCTAM
jgi:hypothetical protein